MKIEINFAETNGLDGSLTIRAGGTPDVVIADEPWHHLMHLCAALPELAQGHTVGVPYSSMPGGYELSRQGREVAVSGDYLPTAAYDFVPFASALLDAANRWLAVEVADAARDGVAPAVREAVEAGRAAMATVPPPRPE